MTETPERLRRFSRRHIVNHLIMLIAFTGLILTGMPQKFPNQPWAKGIVLIIGGVQRTRALHHFLGTIMVFQLVWAVLENLWFHVAKRLPMPMVPRLQDVKDFFRQVRFNLGVDREPPRMNRYTFAEKVEYLALVWGTGLMVLTGLILLFPVRWGTLVPGEVILAAKAAHGGEALLAVLSILTWHVYFVHLRHWNKSMFNGYLDEEAYAEEHPVELEAIRRGETPEPDMSPVSVTAFAVLAVGVLLLTAVTWLWLTSGRINILTVMNGH
jgi:cytochrome b subunit of formate dehydrogenase